MTKQDCARQVCEALAPMKDWEHQSARVWRSAAEQLASIELKGRLLSAADWLERWGAAEEAPDAMDAPCATCQHDDKPSDPHEEPCNMCQHGWPSRWEPQAEEPPHVCTTGAYFWRRRLADGWDDWEVVEVDHPDVADVEPLVVLFWGTSESMPLHDARRYGEFGPRICGVGEFVGDLPQSPVEPKAVEPTCAECGGPPENLKMADFDKEPQFMCHKCLAEAARVARLRAEIARRMASGKGCCVQHRKCGWQAVVERLVGDVVHVYDYIPIHKEVQPRQWPLSDLAGTLGLEEGK